MSTVTLHQSSRPTPVAQLGATRTSHRWTEPPGNWDRLNTRALFPSSNQWGIPDLPPAELVPGRLVAYNNRHACTTAPPGSAVHFFLDDYRFEVVWTKPQRGLSRPCTVGVSLTPDFSLWLDMPLVMQVWQVYRSRWCGAWLAMHGCTVIPTVSWSTPDSHAFAFAGIARGSVVAVSTVSVHRDPDARALFTAGYTAMCDQLDPSTVLVYGKPLPELDTHPTPTQVYPSRWEDR